MSELDADEVVMSDQARKRLADLRFVGELRQVDANARDCRLVATSHGADGGKDHIDLTLLIAEDGRIADARYRCLATGWDLVLFDAMAEACIGRTPAEAAELKPAQIIEAFVDGDQPTIQLALDAPFPILLKASMLAAGKEPEEAVQDEGPKTAQQLDWDDIGLFEKVRRIEEVLDEQVRPMLASDGGGVDLVDLRDNDLVVQYNGACGSCSSSIGGTMVFIEDALNGALGTSLKLVVQGMDEPEPFIDL